MVTSFLSWDMPFQSHMVVTYSLCWLFRMQAFKLIILLLFITCKNSVCQAASPVALELRLAADTWLISLIDCIYSVLIVYCFPAHTHTHAYEMVKGLFSNLMSELKKNPPK